MSAERLERCLAELYTNARLRERFLRNPERYARRAGLSPDAARALVAIDRDGLALASASFTHKRRSKRRPLLQRIRSWLIPPTSAHE